MPLKLCLLLLLTVPSLAAAQKYKSGKWTLGAELGYAAMNVQVIDDLPHTLKPDEQIVIGDATVGDTGGEGILALHAGRLLNGFLRADALLSMNLVGVGFGESKTATVVNTSTYTTAQVDHGTGSGFITTGVRFLAEDTRGRSAIRPRAALSAVWQWTKGPGVMASAGFTTGSASTRFTVDAGEQFARLGYDRVFKTYLVSNNALLAEQRLSGTKSLHGFSVRLGIDHYVF